MKRVSFLTSMLFCLLCLLSPPLFARNNDTGDITLLPIEIAEFKVELERALANAGYPHYLVDVELSPLDVYPVRYVFTIYQDPSVPWPQLIGLFAHGSFDVAVSPDSTTNSRLIIYPDSFDVYYQGIASTIDGGMLIRGLRLLAGEPEIGASTLSLMAQIILQAGQPADNCIYFSYQVNYWRIFRDANGSVILLPFLPDYIQRYEKALQEAFGNRFLVYIELSPLTIYPPQYSVHIYCITDDMGPGDLSFLIYSINATETDIEILTSTIMTSYLAIYPEPNGKLLYEGMILWLEQIGTPPIHELAPLVLMSKIIVREVTNSGAIRFTDPHGYRWIIYDYHGQTILIPDWQS